MKAFESPYNRPHESPFIQFKDSTYDAVMNGGLEHADVFILWGGRDINPGFYKAKPHPKNQAKTDASLSERDRFEWYLLHEAKTRGIPIIGVCRGAQMICAFAGGTLFQHVTGHNQSHIITTFDNHTMNAAADHHQMMDPRGTNHKVLAWAASNFSNSYEKETEGVSEDPPAAEPEIVYFPDINALAIQPHPEWENKTGSVFLNWVNVVLLPKFLKGEL